MFLASSALHWGIIGFTKRTELLFSVHLAGSDSALHFFQDQRVFSVLAENVFFNLINENECSQHIIGQGSFNILHFFVSDVLSSVKEFVYFFFICCFIPIFIEVSYFNC